jgi:GT2 family glycosyltransferase/2-polyprenyl-3-methyl-5-hydroxy-6-metoxy-1,4-benzoquinol methylase
MIHHPPSPPYRLNEQSQVWHRQDFASISYSDGTGVEERIAAIIQQAHDVSVLSPELSGHCSDWPSLYHLSSSRANILRPFENDLAHAEILEVGSGCGAITRYLGETGATVLALEGSMRRAAIARARCRELDNVTVLAEKFEQFETQARFDVVTLIGVVEYAPVFSPGPNPIRSILEKAKSLLKPEGMLILAIENKLGLKYFAGAPEDHVGSPMYGVEDRYKANEPRTLGIIELKDMLSLAGFGDMNFLAPFPDYKVATSIVTEQGLSCRDFDSGALIRQSVRKDPQLPLMLAFSPEKVWPGLVKNGIALEMANSFLVRATASKPPLPVNPQILAWHYSTRRAPDFCKQTVFSIQKPEGTISVDSMSISGSLSPRLESRMIQWRLPPPSAYQCGRLLSDPIAETISRDGWHIGDLTPYYRQYRDILSKEAGFLGSPTAIDSLSSTLPGALFDLIPQNVVIDENGQSHVFDQEWILKAPVEFGWMMVRSMLFIMQSVVRVGICADAQVGTPADLLMASCKALGMTLSRETLEDYVKRELTVQMEISGRRGFPIPPVSSIIDGALSQQNAWQSIEMQKGRIATLQETVARNVANAAAEATEFRNQIAALRLSWSWRITWPLRAVADLGRSLFGMAGTAHRAYLQYGLRSCIARAIKSLRHEGIRAVLHQIRTPPPVRDGGGRRHVLDRHPQSGNPNYEALGMQEYPQNLNPYAPDANEVRCRRVHNVEGCPLGDASLPGLSVMILNLDHPEFIIPLCDQLLQEKAAFADEGLAFEILVGDTGTTNRRVRAYYKANRNNIRVLPGLKYHFSKNNNVLAREARCDTLLFLNNDIVLPPREPSAKPESPLLIMHRELHGKPGLGIVGAYLYFKDMGVQHAGMGFSKDPAIRGFCYHPRIREHVDPSSWPRFIEVPAVTGACLMVKAACFEQCAGFSEVYDAECQDVDLCLRALRSGNSVGIVNAGPIIHLENGTRPKKDEHGPDRQRFMRRWGSFIESKFL